MTEEKTLIKSVRSESRYRNTLIFIYAIMIGSALLFAIAMGNEASSSVSSLEAYLNKNAKSEAFSNAFSTCFFAWLLFFSLPFSAIPHYLLHKVYYRQSITVTTQRVRCTSGFKDEMNMPIDAISSVAVNTGLFQSITLTCAGNSYSITYLENFQELYDVINKLINEKRVQPVKVNVKPVVQKDCSITEDATEQIRKYKQLLDEGIITQGEFDAKKK